MLNLKIQYTCKIASINQITTKAFPQTNSFKCSQQLEKLQTLCYAKLACIDLENRQSFAKLQQFVMFNVFVVSRAQAWFDCHGVLTKIHAFTGKGKKKFLGTNWSYQTLEGRVMFAIYSTFCFAFLFYLAFLLFFEGNGWEISKIHKNTRKSISLWSEIYDCSRWSLRCRLVSMLSGKSSSFFVRALWMILLKEDM